MAYPWQAHTVDHNERMAHNGTRSRSADLATGPRIALDATTPQRTYQYLRITLVVAVAVIFVSVAIAIPIVGLLPSISHYFYTPARNGFVGALAAASLALFALSGRRVEAVLLDGAALLAPLIAIVPTTMAAGTVPGVITGCSEPCVPDWFLSEVDNGVATYLIVGGLVVIVAVAVFRRIVASLWIAVGVLAALGLSWGFFLDGLLEYGHFIAATLFFGVIAVIALLNAFAAPEPGAEPPHRRMRNAYVMISVLLVLDLIVLAVITLGRFGGPGLLIGETIALVLFAVFWVLQTAQKWNQPNPSLVGVQPPAGR